MEGQLTACFKCGKVRRKQFYIVCVSPGFELGHYLCSVQCVDDMIELHDMHEHAKYQRYS